MKNLDRKVNIVFYILFDLKYQGAEREDFYNLKPEILIHQVLQLDILHQKILKRKKLQFKNIIN